MSSVSRARVGYRKLLKSINVAFKDDTHAVKQAKIQLKNEFLINREVVKSEELQSLFQGIDEVDAMLRFNIVQAGKNNRGNFGMLIKLIYTYNVIHILTITMICYYHISYTAFISTR